MKTRQFARLGQLPRAKRDEFLVAGLDFIGASVSSMVIEVEQASNAGAHRAAALVRSVGREEAGKFLLLLDLCRAPNLSQKQVNGHLKLAGTHLAKLLYAQMADYSIGSRTEMALAIERHRRSLYLDGPNDTDFIMPNDLIDQRERHLYVDLVETDDELQWWRDYGYDSPQRPCRSMYLVAAIARSGLITISGFNHLRAAWKTFDSGREPNYSDWAHRTTQALAGLEPSASSVDDAWSRDAALIIDRWPMPLVEFDLTLEKVDAFELSEARREQHEDWLRREYGYPDPTEYYS